MPDPNTPGDAYPSLLPQFRQAARLLFREVPGILFFLETNRFNLQHFFFSQFDDMSHWELSGDNTGSVRLDPEKAATLLAQMLHAMEQAYGTAGWPAERANARRRDILGALDFEETSPGGRN